MTTKYDFVIIDNGSKAKVEKETIRCLNMGYRIVGSSSCYGDEWSMHTVALIKEYTDKEQEENIK